MMLNKQQKASTDMYRDSHKPSTRIVLIHVINPQQKSVEMYI